MLTTLLLSLAIVVSLVLALLIVPVLLLQRFLSVAASVDEIEEIEELDGRWAGRFTGRAHSFAESMG